MNDLRDDADELPNLHFVQSLARGLAVIRAFDSDRPEMRLSDVARHTGLSRATARRFLLTLVDLGYVRTNGREFALTARVLELGYSYLSSLSLPEIVQPYLEELMAEVHESTSASVLEGYEIAYVARVPTKRIMSVRISMGTRFPAYATSMGRVMLAALSDDVLALHVRQADLKPLTSNTITTVDELLAELEVVRTQGWCMVDQELEMGLRSIAVPLMDSNRRVIAAINVSAQASEATLEEFRARLLGPLQAVADRINSELRSSKPIPALVLGM